MINILVSILMSMALAGVASTMFWSPNFESRRAYGWELRRSQSEGEPVVESLPDEGASCGEVDQTEPQNNPQPALIKRPRKKPKPLSKEDRLMQKLVRSLRNESYGEVQGLILQHQEMRFVEKLEDYLNRGSYDKALELIKGYPFPLSYKRPLQKVRYLVGIEAEPMYHKARSLGDLESVIDSLLSR